MKNLNPSQVTFFNMLNTLSFKNKVQRRTPQMGADGALYFTLGEMQSESNNYSFDDLNEDQKDDFIGALIIEMPELEF